MHGGELWKHHPGVRSGDQLTLGERAADHLKAAFGSWAFLMILNGFIVIWISVNLLLSHAFDPYPFILLNLGLSWLAAQQGGALQIAANRGDRISAEVAAHTRSNTDDLLQINRQQLLLLDQLGEVRALLKARNGGAASVGVVPVPGHPGADHGDGDGIGDGGEPHPAEAPHRPPAPADGTDE